MKSKKSPSRIGTNKMDKYEIKEESFEDTDEMSIPIDTYKE